MNNDKPVPFDDFKSMPTETVSRKELMDRYPSDEKTLASGPALCEHVEIVEDRIVEVMRAEMERQVEWFRQYVYGIYWGIGDYIFRNGKEPPCPRKAREMLQRRLDRESRPRWRKRMEELQLRKLSDRKAGK